VLTAHKHQTKTSRTCRRSHFRFAVSALGRLGVNCRAAVRTVESLGFHDSRGAAQARHLLELNIPAVSGERKNAGLSKFIVRCSRFKSHTSVSYFRNLSCAKYDRLPGLSLKTIRQARQLVATEIHEHCLRRSSSRRST